MVSAAAAVIVPTACSTRAGPAGRIEKTQAVALAAPPPPTLTWCPIDVHNNEVVATARRIMRLPCWAGAEPVVEDRTASATGGPHVLHSRAARPHPVVRAPAAIVLAAHGAAPAVRIR